MIVQKNCSILSCDESKDEQAQSLGKRKPSAFSGESGIYGSIWLD